MLNRSKKNKKRIARILKERNYLEFFWDYIDNNVSRFVFFGVNEQTRNFLRAADDKQKSKVIAVVDENVGQDHIEEVPTKIISWKPPQIDIVVVSSDSNENGLAQKAKQWIGDQSPITRCYNDLLLRLFIDKDLGWPPTAPLVTKGQKPPKTNYVICSSQRSGSTLLCDLLAKTGLAGNPIEYFDDLFNILSEENLIHYKDFIRKFSLFNQADNGVFGSKIHWYQYEKFERMIRKDPSCRYISREKVLEDIFPNLFYIYITRQDHLKQAISLLKATQTNFWHQIKESVQPREELEYNFIEINKCLQRVKWQDRSWRKFFKRYKIRPFVVEYESFIKNQKQVCRQVLEFIGLAVSKDWEIPRASYEKMADKISDQWYEQYIKDSRKPFKVLLAFIINTIFFGYEYICSGKIRLFFQIQISQLLSP